MPRKHTLFFFFFAYFTSPIMEQKHYFWRCITIRKKGSYIEDIENAKELRNVYNIETFKKREEACRTIIDGTRFINIPDWVIDLYCVTGSVLRFWNRIGSMGDYDTFGEFSRRYIEAIDEFNKLICEHRDVLV